MRSVEVVCLVSFGVFLLAFVLLTVGFAVPYWYSVEPDGGSGSEVWRGLWRVCTEDSNGDDNCDNLDIQDEEEWFRATIALIACSFIFALVAGLSAMFLPVTSGLQILAGLFAIVGAAIFASEVKELADDNDDYDFSLLWGFGMACGAGVLFVLNGLFVACYAGYLGCYVDPVAPCCRDFRTPWSKRRRYYEDDYGYGGSYPPVDRRQSAFVSYPGAQPRPSVYMSQPRQSMYPGGRPAPTMASTGFGTAYQPQPRASIYPGAVMPRGSIYPY